MKKRLLFMLVACCMSAMAVFAGRPDYIPQSAGGKVVDSYTRELLTDFQADLLRPDSTLIKSYFKRDANMFNQQVNLLIDSLPDSDCILYVTAEGYYPMFMNIKQPGKSEWGIELRPLMMNRVPFYQPKKLDEVTVTASKLKMVMKGDTIVYNADAFALAQGSMLDGLISQLPGVELKGDGRIYVNGKFVNELMVNGENFFKGDPKIALENLPAYMVNDVRVYNRDDYRERRPKEELPLVMDVKLKKQYQTGWIANAEAGYGTSNRYLGRLFGLMFTRDSRLSIVANVNNTNDDRKPGQTDSWNPNWQTAGRADIVKAGIDYLWNSRLRSWKIETNLLAEHKKGNLESEQNSERYLEGGNMLGTSSGKSVSKEWKFSTNDKVTFHVPRINVEFAPKASFIREKATSVNASTTSDALGELLNSLNQTSETYRRLWEVGANLYAGWDLPQSTATLSNRFNVDWKDRHLESLTDRNLLFSQQPEQNDHSSLQELLPERRLKIDETVRFANEYDLSKAFSGWWNVQYLLRHTNLNSTRNYYEETDLDLPSVTQRNSTLVPSKSFHYVAVENIHSVQGSFTNFFPHVSMFKRRDQFNLSADVKVSYAPGHINYEYQNRIISARRSPWYVEPKVRMNLMLFVVGYSYKTVLNNLLDLVDVTDAANPLYVYAGNPDLKIGRVHSVDFMSWWFLGKGVKIDATFNKYENMVAQSAFYDTTTGVTTYRPVNVNGNWDVTAAVDVSRPLDSRKNWNISSNTSFVYRNSVDIINLEQSTVRNLNLREKLALTYKIRPDMEIAAKGNADYRRVTAPRPDFATINAVDFDYGLVYSASKLPWNLSVTTDIMMHSRRGYSDSRLNTNHLVWNARIAKSIMQGNLTFALDGFDILGQLTNVQLTMNSQGRTEARYNTLPRYAMLHILYRLNLQPKKK